MKHSINRLLSLSTQGFCSAHIELNWVGDQTFPSCSGGFWDIQACDRRKASLRSRGMCSPHILVRRVSQSSNWTTGMALVTCSAMLCLFGLFSTLNMEAVFSSETSLTLKSLHFIMSQKTEFFNKVFVFQHFLCFASYHP
jgi:hypothetical protein